MFTAATVPSIGLTIVPWARLCWAAVTLACAASAAAWSATSSADVGPDSDGVDTAAGAMAPACWLAEAAAAALESIESSVDSALARSFWAAASCCWALRAACRSSVHCDDAPPCWAGTVVLVVLVDDDEEDAPAEPAPAAQLD